MKVTFLLKSDVVIAVVAQVRVLQGRGPAVCGLVHVAPPTTRGAVHPQADGMIDRMDISRQPEQERVRNKRGQ